MSLTSGTFHLSLERQWVLVFTKTTKHDLSHSDRNLCPSTSLEDNVQCCVENSHNGLKRRWTFNRNDPDYIGTGIGNSVSGSTYSNGNGFDLSSAAGVMSTLNNNDAPSVGTGIAPIVPISPLGGFEPTTPGANVALSGDASTSTGTLGALPITANTIGTTSDTSGGVAPGISDTSIALGGTTPAGTNTAIALGGTTPAGTDLALSGTTPAGIDIASGGTTPASSSNFNLAQIDNYSQSPGGMSPGGSTPDEGVSFGLNHGLRPEVTYTNGGGSTFSVGPTTSVPGMLMNPGSSINGVQGGFSMDFRKLKRSLANAFI